MSSRIVVVALVGLALAGCATWPSGMTEREKVGELDMGYGALRQLLDDEGSLDGILLVKPAGPETEALVEDIASLSSQARERLDALCLLPPAVRIDRPSALPLVEQATRDSIATKTALDLLFSADTFEVRLLMSQGQALRYARFLAESLASRDPSEARRTWLEGLADRYEELYRRVVELLEVAR